MLIVTCSYCNKKIEANKNQTSVLCTYCGMEFIISDFSGMDVLYTGNENKQRKIQREITEIRIKEIDRKIEYFMAEKSSLDLLPLMKNHEYDVCFRKRDKLYKIFTFLIKLNLVLIPCFIFAGIIFMKFNNYVASFFITAMFISVISLLFMPFLRELLPLFFLKIPPETVINEKKRNDELNRLDYIDTRIQSLKEEAEKLKNIK